MEKWKWKSLLSFLLRNMHEQKRARARPSVHSFAWRSCAEARTRVLPKYVRTPTWSPVRDVNALYNLSTDNFSIYSTDCHRHCRRRIIIVGLTINIARARMYHKLSAVDCNAVAYRLRSRRDFHAKRYCSDDRWTSRFSIIRRSTSLDSLSCARERGEIYCSLLNKYMYCLSVNYASLNEVNSGNEMSFLF